MEHKYVRQGYKKKGDGGNGRYVDPDAWITGPDPLRREKYYAFLKHRAQAKFRGEDYYLSFDDWESFWDDHTFEQRGRSYDSLCLTREDFTLPWSKSNCYICTRGENLKRNAYFRSLNDV